MKLKLCEDLSTLTTVDLLSIARLFDKITWCASDAVANAAKGDDKSVELDLGFGSVIINLDDSSIKYRFIPSKLFERAMIDSYVNEHNQLDLNIEKNLAKKLTTIYKEMF